MLQIHANQEKRGQDRLLPIAPEFAEVIPATAAADRTGRVFPLAVHKRETACQVISDIGRSAAVTMQGILKDSGS
jgi:hypothetical protein